MEEKTFVRLYTGNGQGKTTAAFGVALRVLCAGKRVFIGQFVKDEAYNEVKICEHFDNVEVKQLGEGCFLFREATDEDVRVARKGLAQMKEKMCSGDYGLVVLDELCIALYYNLLSEAEVKDALDARNAATEVIITGRYAPEWLVEYAELVTDMQEVKHYYSKGVLSRDGYDH